MDAATIGLIGKSTPDRITVVGGTAAVSQGVFDHAQRLAWTQRAAGANRYETSARIGAMWQSARRVYLATGENFPDALTGGVLAAKSDAPLFLIQPRCPAASFNAVSAWLDTTRLTILGGRTIAISQAPSQAGCTTVAPIEPRWEGPYLQ